MTPIPQELQKFPFPESARVRSEHERVKQLNHTKECIVLSGNREGFFVLSNCLILWANQLIGDFRMSDLSPLYSGLDIVISVHTRKPRLTDGRVVLSRDGVYVWEIENTALSDVATLMHALSYATDELHLDEGLADDDISVYCYVE